MPQVAELRSVSMAYGSVEALNDVSINLSAGETLALLGPNGAGKSTAIGLLTGLKRVQKGSVSLFGENPRRTEVRRKIGVTPQDAAFPHAMKVGEILDFARSHYPEPVPRDELIDAFDLDRHMGRIAVTLSGGQQRRLAVALAFCGAPKAVFLDEPTTGLDTETRKRLWNYIGKFRADGGAVFLTTHYLEEAEMLADRIILIDHGVVVRSGTVDEVRSAVDVRVIRFDCNATPKLQSARLHGVSGSRHTFLSGDADGTVRELVQTEIDFSDLEVLPASLDDAVSELLGRSR